MTAKSFAVGYNGRVSEAFVLSRQSTTTTSGSSPGSTANIAIISQLHKGRRERFVALVDHYFAEGVSSLNARQAGIESLCAQGRFLVPA